MPCGGTVSKNVACRLSFYSSCFCCVFSAFDLFRTITVVMCHFSTLGLCPALSPSCQHLISEDKGNQSAVQLDATFAGTMPPIPAAKPAPWNPGLSWNAILTLLIFCSLAIILMLFRRQRKKTRQNGAFATQQRLKKIIKPYTTSCDPTCPHASASQPYLYLPPPPGSVLTTEPCAVQISPLHSNSGILAAQAMAKLWRDPTLPPEAEVRHPWRRHSQPLPKAVSDDGTNVVITRDADHYFDDADLNGFWRRRTLEFA